VTVKPTKQFKSIQPGTKDAAAVSFCNPYENDPYTRNSSRAELCKFWSKENKLREQELNMLKDSTGYVKLK